MQKTEAQVRRLIRQYHSAEPETLCEKMGIITLEQDLPQCVNGFTVEMNGMRFIVTKYEREADSFAAWLLLLLEMSELNGRESVTAEDAAKIAHIPLSVADNAFRT